MWFTVSEPLRHAPRPASTSLRPATAEDWAAGISADFDCLFPPSRTIVTLTGGLFVKRILTVFIVALLFAAPVRADNAAGESGSKIGRETKKTEKKSGPATRAGDKNSGRDAENVGEKTANEAKKTKKSIVDWLWEAWVRTASALKNMGRNIWTKFERT